MKYTFRTPPQKPEQSISEHNFSNILKTKIFSGEQICIAQGKFTLPGKLPQTEILYLFWFFNLDYSR